MKKKPLVILAQDEFFTQWLKEKEDAEKVVEETKAFMVKTLSDAVDKNIKPVWDRAQEELIRRGLVNKEEMSPIGGYDPKDCEAECRKSFLTLVDGVLYLDDGCPSGNPLEALIGQFGR